MDMNNEGHEVVERTQTWFKRETIRCSCGEQFRDSWSGWKAQRQWLNHQTLSPKFIVCFKDAGMTCLCPLCKGGYR